MERRRRGGAAASKLYGEVLSRPRTAPPSLADRDARSCSLNALYRRTHAEEFAGGLLSAYLTNDEGLWQPKPDAPRQTDNKRRDAPRNPGYLRPTRGARHCAESPGTAGPGLGATDARQRQTQTAPPRPRAASAAPAEARGAALAAVRVVGAAVGAPGRLPFDAAPRVQVATAARAPAESAAVDASARALRARRAARSMTNSVDRLDRLEALIRRSQPAPRLSKMKKKPTRLQKRLDRNTADRDDGAGGA